MRILLSFIILVTAAPGVFSQGGYYLSRKVALPDTVLVGGTTALSIPTNREDVKAIGMGKTQVADGKTFNGMMYNPALLARPRVSIEALNVQASLPTTTYDAVRFLSNHSAEFKQALFLTKVRKGVDDFNAATTSPDKLAALQEIQDGLKFPQDLLDNVIGSSTDPKQHAAQIIPAIAVQVGNFGFSLYGTAQAGFQVIQSSTLDALLSVNIPKDLSNPPEVAKAVTQLLGVLETVTDANGNISLGEALPEAYAVSYIDIVGAAGYARTINPRLSLGANLKIINRRFSTKRVASDNFDNILREVQSDLNSSITGFTLDIGGLYKLGKLGTEVGVSLQNVIPVQTISSTATANFVLSANAYDKDATGNYILNANRDTAIVAYSKKVQVEAPFRLELPVIANIGIYHPLSPHWDVNFDWVDVAAQDVRFDSYLDRFRIGTEYRVDAIKDLLGVAGRCGIADRHISLGIGLNIFRALNIDAAFAYDSFVQENAYYAQVRLGW